MSELLKVGIAVDYQKLNHFKKELDNLGYGYGVTFDLSVNLAVITIYIEKEKAPEFGNQIQLISASFNPTKTTH